MHLQHLSLTDFRNYSRLDVNIPSQTVILVGNNAQGKTSLLEAVYFLATLTSFHASADRELVNFLKAREPLAVARIVGLFTRGADQHRIEVRIIQEKNGANGSPRVRKEVLVDGLKRKVGEAVGCFNAVIFLPQMLRVIEGSPEHRRRYINLALTQVLPDYSAYLSRYARVLSQRNALLKNLKEANGDTAQLDYWDEQLSEVGAKIIFARIHALQELEALASRAHFELTHRKEVLRLNYCPSFDPLPAPRRQFTLALDDPRDRTGCTLEQIQTGFSQALAQRRSEEISRGATLLGPHRDELRFLVNGIDQTTYGSRGQARTILLTLKLAEVEWMKSKTGYWPVVLLDEVLAELDPQRRQDLLVRLSVCQQVLLTTTDLKLFPDEFLEGAQIWEIEEGHISN